MTWGDLRLLIDNKFIKVEFFEDDKEIGILNIRSDFYDHLIVKSVYFFSNGTVDKLIVKVVE